jgi:uncharacterized membrane protein YGL010W
MLNFASELLIFITGYNFNYIQDIFEIRNLEDGVKYYAEVHTSFWNSLIHTMFMPVTMVGMYLWIPAIFNLNNIDALQLKENIMIFYIGLYSKISFVNTIVIMNIYFYPFIYSTELYKSLYNYNNNAKYCFIYGFSISLFSLSFQEIIGHYIGGDAPSRIEAIPNAILYAKYYSVSHLLE